jgi:hypothetical protein
VAILCEADSAPVNDGDTAKTAEITTVAEKITVDDPAGGASATKEEDIEQPACPDGFSRE